MKTECLSGEGKRFHFEEEGKKKEGYRVYLIDDSPPEDLKGVVLRNPAIG
jgi:hypothetical protein